MSSMGLWGTPLSQLSEDKVKSAKLSALRVLRYYTITSCEKTVSVCVSVYLIDTMSDAERTNQLYKMDGPSGEPVIGRLVWVCLGH